MMSPRVLVCGGRKFRDRKLVYAALDKLYNSFYIGRMTIIEGGALGADRLAQDWANQAHIDVDLITCEAEWDKYGDSAGFKRNSDMADLKPDICLAFKGGRGTQNMIDICRERSIKVHTINWKYR
ncbi:hypothetical protein [Vibrio phage XZ1]|uniref:YspA cpYpsA-related SLOG domain-containing protein n=3 Tax=Schizotequatrovirus TaxID=1198137 RepID=A0A0D4DBJ6_9CAUD|nr:GTP-binding domain [Vibrio phage ValKK3]AJT60948.1 hypothetical protein [Vibrio phage ValKK3]QNJ54945.1 hypothetical protein vBValMR11Z_19 [Vibrio phage vB_ValM_R11Z]UOL51374.1 hypothetical protein [Vibrio phage XZ1]